MTHLKLIILYGVRYEPGFLKIFFMLYMVIQLFQLFVSKLFFILSYLVKKKSIGSNFDMNLKLP